jgi:hypothetical protein
MKRDQEEPGQLSPQRKQMQPNPYLRPKPMPENQQSEWKSTWQDRHLEWVCAATGCEESRIEAS